MFYILGWAIFGSIAGFIASKVVHAHGQGCFVNIALGIVGAVVGGAMFRFLGAPGPHGFLWSLFVAVIGAIVVLLLFQAASGKNRLR
jgi:uncharacterized membrane protein YeaQ/YmgE (transglycosylase-associated protein family)